MKLALLNMLILTIALPAIVGIAEVNEVQINTTPESENVLFAEEFDLPKDRVSGDFTGSIRIPNPDYPEGEPCPAATGFCDYTVGIFKGVLKTDATLIFEVVEAPETSLKGLIPIGNKVIMNLPLDAVNLDNPVPILGFQAPSFPGAYENAIGSAFAEISITLSDGREYVTLRNYKLGNAIFMQRADIKLALERFDLPKPKTLRISVLPVRRAGPDTNP